MKIQTQLLEYLTRKCVREVLDQLSEEANASKLKSSGIGKDDNKEPAKQKIPVKPFKAGSKKKVNITKLDESENPELGGDMAPPGDGQGTGDQPEVPKEEPKPEPKPEEPSEPPVPRIPKGAVLLNPKDKSKLQPIKLQARDEASIERTLHQVAVSTAGPRTKVSLGAKRLAREIAANPSATIFFYIGKTDPESEEVFLMADKSLQIAKDDSIQPGELTGTPVISPTHNYPVYGQQNDMDRQTDPDNKYADWFSRGKRTIGPTPRYGIDEPELNESATNLIKKAVNKILNA